MCGRYAIAPSRDDAWASVGELLGSHIEASLAALEPRFNVAPTTQIPIVLQDRGSGEIRAALARWGFIPHWWKEPKPPANAINARSEEAARKPMWRDAWVRNRCLITATHWYEWSEAAGVKQPYALQPQDRMGFMFAGLYSEMVTAEGELVYTAAVVTRDASPSLAAVHDRMPLILNPLAWRMWLDPNRGTPEAVREVLIEHAVDEAIAWRVSPRVNSARNDGPELLIPLDG